MGKNILLALVTTTILLYLLEIGIGIMHWSNVRSPTQTPASASWILKRIEFARRNNLPFDNRPKIQVLLDLRQSGDMAFPVMIPSELFRETGYMQLSSGEKVYPLSSVTESTNVWCNEPGRWIIYKSDEYGFHNPEGLYQPGNVDIAAIGDSFTHGSCVDSNKNIISLIRNSYPNTLNFGIGGAGPLIELATFREYVEPLKPKIVLWLYFGGNDLFNLAEEKKNPILIRYLDENFRQDLLSQRPQLDERLKELLNEKIEHRRQSYKKSIEQWHRRRHKIAFESIWLSNIRQEFLRRISPKEDDLNRIDEAVVTDPHNYALFHQIIKSAYKTTLSWGGKFYFIDLDGKHEGIREIVEGLEIPIIKPYQAILAHKDPLALYPYRIPGGHYGEKGYEIIANTIVQELQTDRSIN
ncbi:hypothetical protein CSA56_06260 [candidate division KSB3 bacterium]|uniref:SGNH hydrolase-type esterase domain-containing protein n=1 Tax=candidate division KSB3 bacterium TaxID=2044937 RepID=A0A2G6KGX6_9BACT|nr:MAG: hypothetical protein CSA56_06260 [candidate division KSB3 bacterium]